MSPSEVSIDIDRALEGAVSDSGEALQLRHRLATDSGLRRALRTRVEGDRLPDELEPREAARRATALFILGRDGDVGRYASRAEDHHVHYLWGLSELYNDRPLEACRALHQCVEREPRNEQARLKLAAVQALVGNPEQSRRTLEPLAGQKDRPQVLHVLGTIAEAEGRYADAETHYQSALGHDPDHVDSLFRLAYQYDLSTEDEAAITLYERARRIRPVRANVLLNLGVLYEDRGEFTKAADCYRQLLTLFPDHPRARAYLRDAESSQDMVVDDDMERTEDRRNQILRTPITDFELSVRSRNCLSKMNITTLGDLISRTEAELLSYKNFGETSLQEIKDILGAKSLRLGMKRDEVLAASMASSLLADDEMPMIPELPDEPEDVDPELLDKPVSDLNLSIRSVKCMSLMNVTTVRELLQHSEAELLRTKNFGATSLQEIKDRLAEMGVALRRS